MSIHTSKIKPVLFFLCLLWLSSCIPTKKVVYLENFDGEEM
ncbi:MAG: hypothetical protein RIC95_13580 [Vicingaceae bacterium]